MSAQNQTVFRHCMRVADDLDAEGRLEEAESVLRALGVYLQALPATADASCQHTVEGRLNRLSPRVRAQADKRRV